MLLQDCVCSWPAGVGGQYRSGVGIHRRQWCINRWLWQISIGCARSISGYWQWWRPSLLPPPRNYAVWWISQWQVALQSICECLVCVVSSMESQYYRVIDRWGTKNDGLTLWVHNAPIQCCTSKSVLLSVVPGAPARSHHQGCLESDCRQGWISVYYHSKDDHWVAQSTGFIDSANWQQVPLLHQCQVDVSLEGLFDQQLNAYGLPCRHVVMYADIDSLCSCFYR